MGIDVVASSAPWGTATCVRPAWSALPLPAFFGIAGTMCTSLKRVTLFWHRIAGSLVLAAMLSGCVQRDHDAVLTSGTRAHAVLAAARARQVTMFGDFPDARNAGYFTRASASLKQHTFAEVGGDFDPDLDPAGVRMVFASTRHNVQPDLYIKSVDGVAVTQLTSDPASDVQPTFSPDGTRVAFASNRSGNWDIWIIRVDGGPPIRMTHGMADEIHPSWSPDGSTLVYCGMPSAGGQWELWTLDVDGGSTRRFIGYGLFPEWSPTGDTIVFQRARERDSHWFSIWTMTFVDGEPRYPTELAAGPNQAMILPSWSPDGRRITFVGVPTTWAGIESVTVPSTVGLSDVWVMDADGRGKIRLTDGHTGNYAPVFAPDGRMFFTSNRSGHENIWSLSPVGNPVRNADGRGLTREATHAEADHSPVARTVSDRGGL